MTERDRDSSYKLALRVRSVLPWGRGRVYASLVCRDYGKLA